MLCKKFCKKVLIKKVILKSFCTTKYSPQSFLFSELSQLEDLNTNRITRILTTDFPQYFAIVSRIRQEVHAIGPEGE